MTRDFINLDDLPDIDDFDYMYKTTCQQCGALRDDCECELDDEE